MGKFKHNKLRNTGLLFEFLLRQVTVDVLNKEKESSALKIIKKQFNEHTELGKELALYNLLMTTKFKSDKKADYFLNEILRQRREKYNLVNEVKNHYDLPNLFSSKVPRYKVFASIYKLFEGFTTLSPEEKTDSYFIVLESVTTISKKKTNTFIELKTRIMV